MSKGARMRIGEVADRAGVPAKTIRFWEDQHLLPPPARTPAGYRDYDPAILERLAFIRHAQAAGLTLDAIGQVLDIGDGGQPPCVHVAGLIARRLTEVEARLAELARTRDQLAALAARRGAGPGRLPGLLLDHRRRGAAGCPRPSGNREGPAHGQ